MSAQSNAEPEPELQPPGNGGGLTNYLRDVLHVSIDREARIGDMVPVRAEVRSIRSAWLATMRHVLTVRRVGSDGDSAVARWLAQPKLGEDLGQPAFARSASAGQPPPAFMSGGWRPHRDSNPGFSLERAAS